MTALRRTAILPSDRRLGWRLRVLVLAVSALVPVIVPATSASASPLKLHGERKGYPIAAWNAEVAKDLMDMSDFMGQTCASTTGGKAGIPGDLRSKVGGMIGSLLFNQITGAGNPCLISVSTGAIGRELWENQNSMPYVRFAQYEVDRGRLRVDPCEIQMQVNKLKLKMVGRAAIRSACGESIGFGNWGEWEAHSSVATPVSPAKAPAPAKAPPPAPAKPSAPRTAPAPAPARAPVPAPSYTWKWVSQGQFTDSSKSQPLDPNDLSPGQSGWMVVEAKNTGTATWTNSNPNPVLLGTDRPRDRASQLATLAWVHPNRPAYLMQSSVPPGGVGSFEFPFVAPQSGSIREDFNLVAEGKTWMNSEGLYFEFRTRPAAPPVAPGPPVDRTVYEVWGGGAQATAVGYSPGAWSMVEFRVPAESPWVRRASANIGGASVADFHVYLHEGGAYHHVVSTNGVAVANNGETWAELAPTRLDPNKVYLLQVVLPQGGSVYYARHSTPGALRTFTWCDQRPNDGCPHTDIAQNGRIIASDAPS